MAGLASRGGTSGTRYYHLPHSTSTRPSYPIQEPLPQGVKYLAEAPLFEVYQFKSTQLLVLSLYPLSFGYSPSSPLLQELTSLLRDAQNRW